MGISKLFHVNIANRYQIDNVSALTDTSALKKALKSVGFNPIMCTLKPIYAAEVPYYNCVCAVNPQRDHNMSRFDNQSYFGCMLY